MYPMLDLVTDKIPGYIVPLALSSAFLYYRLSRARNAQPRPPWHPPLRIKTATANILSIFYLVTFTVTATSMVRHPTWTGLDFALSIAHIFALSVLEIWLDRTDAMPRAFAAQGWILALYNSLHLDRPTFTIAEAILSLPAACHLGHGEDVGLGLSGALLLIVALRDALPRHIVKLGYWVPIPVGLTILARLMAQRSRTFSRLQAASEQHLRGAALAFAGISLLFVGWVVSGIACYCFDWQWLLLHDKVNPDLNGFPFLLLLNLHVYLTFWCLLGNTRRQQRDIMLAAENVHSEPERLFWISLEATGWAVVLWQFLWWILLAVKMYYGPRWICRLK